MKKYFKEYWWAFLIVILIVLFMPTWNVAVGRCSGLNPAMEKHSLWDIIMKNFKRCDPNLIY